MVAVTLAFVVIVPAFCLKLQVALVVVWVNELERILPFNALMLKFVAAVICSFELIFTL